MMRKLLVALGMVAMCASSGRAETGQDAQIRRLFAENRLLKAQIKTLQKKLGIGPAVMPTTRKATTQKATTPKATTQEAKTGPTKTFAIHEANPAWWRDPAAFTFEIHLREILAPTLPTEAPSTWMMRNKLLAGKKLAWTLRLVSASSVTEAIAGQQLWAMRASLENQRKQIESLKLQAQSMTDAAQKAAMDRSIVASQLALAQTEAQGKLWQKLLGYKGGTVLQAVYRQRRKGSYYNVLDVRMALPADEAAKLRKYQNNKRTRHPNSRQQYWPIGISGKVDSVRYDGMTIYVIVDGKWKSVDGDGSPRKVPPRTKHVRLIPAETDRPGYVGVRY